MNLINETEAQLDERETFLSREIEQAETRLEALQGNLATLRKHLSAVRRERARRQPKEPSVVDEKRTSLAARAEAIWPIGWSKEEGEGEGDDVAVGQVGLARLCIAHEDDQLMISCLLGEMPLTEELVDDSDEEEIRSTLQSCAAQLRSAVGVVPDLLPGPKE